MLFDHFRNSLRRVAARLGTLFLRDKQERGQRRRALLHRYSPVSFTIYNDKFPVYPPHYCGDLLPSGDEPEIYNRDGERLRLFFFRDYYASFFAPAPSRHFLCDRWNIGLDTHFYGHASMLETMGKPARRYGYLFETRAVIPDDYRIFDRHAGLHKDFDLIFTNDRDIIDKYGNARFWPNWARSWIPEALSTPDLVDRKTKNASIVSSAKTTCALHLARIAAARHLQAHPELGVDAFGTFDGGKLIPIEDSLLDYRYSVAVENFVSPWMFTERLINCFATCTVPIYVGATDVGKFFNTDGIIQITPEDLPDIGRVVSQCSESDYASRREAILDNFNRAKEYGNPWDYLYTRYLQ